MDFTVSLATGRARWGPIAATTTQDCVKDMRERWVTTHVAQKKHSAIDGRTTRHAGYVVSLCIRTRWRPSAG